MGWISGAGVCLRGFRHRGGGTKLTVREAHGEDERRGKEDRKGSQTPDDPKVSADWKLIGKQFDVIGKSLEK